jgi:hypothetical protein
MIFLSHGIGLLYSGTHLLDEVLLRIEGTPSPWRQRVAQHMEQRGPFSRDADGCSRRYRSRSGQD